MYKDQNIRLISVLHQQINNIIKQCQMEETYICKRKTHVSFHLFYVIRYMYESLL